MKSRRVLFLMLLMIFSSLKSLEASQTTYYSSGNIETIITDESTTTYLDENFFGEDEDGHGRGRRSRRVFADGKEERFLEYWPNSAKVKKKETYQNGSLVRTDEYNRLGDPIAVINNQESQNSQFGTTAHDYATGIVFDSHGNYYVSGTTSGLLNGVQNVSQDFFITKYSANGAVLWTKLSQVFGEEDAAGLAIDSNDNLYLTGYVQGIIDGVSVGGGDAYIVKYDSEGNRLWAKQSGAEYNQRGGAINVDSLGNIYIVGSTNGPLDGQLFEGAEVVSSQAFITKYDPSGSKLWTRLAGSSGTYIGDTGNAVATDSLGNVYMQVNYYGGGSQGAFIVKYDSSGNITWNKPMGGLIDDIMLDAEGNLYIVGNYESPGGNNQIFVVKMNGNGQQLWTRNYGSFGNGRAKDMLIGQDGNLYITGYTNGNLDGNGPIPNGTQDSFVLAINPEGADVALRQLRFSGTQSSNQVSSFAQDSHGALYIVGNVLGHLDGQIGIGGFDAFLSRLTIEYSSIGRTTKITYANGDIYEYYDSGNRKSTYTAVNSYLEEYYNENFYGLDPEGVGFGRISHQVFSDGHQLAFLEYWGNTDTAKRVTSYQNGLLDSTMTFYQSSSLETLSKPDGTLFTFYEVSHRIKSILDAQGNYVEYYDDMFGSGGAGRAAKLKVNGGDEYRYTAYWADTNVYKQLEHYSGGSLVSTYTFYASGATESLINPNGSTYTLYEDSHRIKKIQQSNGDVYEYYNDSFGAGGNGRLSRIVLANQTEFRFVEYWGDTNTYKTVHYYQSGLFLGIFHYDENGFPTGQSLSKVDAGTAVSMPIELASKVDILATLANERKTSSSEGMIVEHSYATSS